MNAQGRGRVGQGRAIVSRYPKLGNHIPCNASQLHFKWRPLSVSSSGGVCVGEEGRSLYSRAPTGTVGASNLHSLANEGNSSLAEWHLKCEDTYPGYPVRVNGAGVRVSRVPAREELLL